MMEIESRAELVGIISAPVSLFGVLNAQDLVGDVVAIFDPHGQVAEYASLSGEMTYLGAMTGSLDIPAIIGGVPYSGEYEVTPSQSTQTLQTSGKILSADIVVNPIPSNYGLIEWNGSTLTVS